MLEVLLKEYCNFNIKEIYKKNNFYINLKKN